MATYNGCTVGAVTIAETGPCKVTFTHGDPPEEETKNCSRATANELLAARREGETVPQIVTDGGTPDVVTSVTY